MMKDSFVEEKLPERVNMSVWVQILPYLKKYWLFSHFYCRRYWFYSFL